MMWYRMARAGSLGEDARSAWMGPWQVGRVILPLDAALQAEPRAWVSSLNPMGGVAPAAAPPGPVVLRTGWSEREGDRPAWMPGGREALEEFLAGMPAGVEVWLWPAADHVLSDVPSIAGFLRRHADGAGASVARVRLLFDPASLLAPSMLARAEDHLVRMFEALASHPGTAALLLANLAPESDIEGARLVGWHWGAIAPTTLADLVRAHAASSAAIVLMDDRLGEQVEALEGRGLRGT